MSDERITISEIAELFSNPDNIHRDMSEGLELVKEHFHRKYVEKMMKSVDNYYETSKKNPPPEIRLLKAWKPFVQQESHEKIDGLIDMLHTFNMLRQIRDGAGITRAAFSADNRDESVSAQAMKSGQEVFAADSNSSVHSDGVYDIDEQCYANRFGARFPAGFDGVAGVMMLMSAMNGR